MSLTLLDPIEAFPDHVQERAAIQEYDGGLDREDAETAAKLAYIESTQESCQ